MIKKFCYAILTIFLIATIVSAAEPAHPLQNDCENSQLGDVDGDGELSIRDYFHLALHVRGKISLPCENLADVNGDNKIDFRDSRYLFDYFYEGGPAPGCASFAIGDANADGTLDISDSVYIALYLEGKKILQCPNVADANSDGIVNEEDIKKIQEDLFPNNDEDTGIDETDCENLPLGDVNADGKLNIADPVAINSYLFDNAPLKCKELGNVNGDNILDTKDSNYILSYLFEGGPALINPDLVDCSSLELGDANADGKLDISDPIFITMYLREEAELKCKDIADVNADNTVDFEDSRYILSYLFEGGPAPVSEPGEISIECHTDADCGETEFTGQPFCSNNVISGNLKKPTCNNPGTPESFCSFKTIEKPVDGQQCIVVCN